MHSLVELKIKKTDLLLHAIMLNALAPELNSQCNL